MNDVLREVTQRGWGSRLKNAFTALLFGVLIIIAAFGLEWWNEGRAVKRAQDLAEGAASVVSVIDATVRADNNDRLVHVSARVTAETPLTEPDFGFQVTALSLSRSVEMYQWIEKRDSKTRRKPGGGEESVTEYRYEKKWKSGVEDSDKFHVPDGHRNPERMSLDSERWIAESGRLGEFRLDSELLSRLGGRESFSPPADAEPVDAAFTRDGKGFYRGTSSSQPAIGDLRVTFRRVPEGVHTIIAQQSGSSLKPYTTHGGRSLLLLRKGRVGAVDMFKKAQSDNTALTWMLRAAGIGAMWLGLVVLFRPLVVLADVLPIAGRIVGVGTGLVALLIAFVLSLITIATAWLWYRPLLGLLLIGAALTAFHFLFNRVRKQPSPPPPPGSVVVSTPPPPPTA